MIKISNEKLGSSSKWSREISTMIRELVVEVLAENIWEGSDSEWCKLSSTWEIWKCRFSSVKPENVEGKEKEHAVSFLSKSLMLPLRISSLMTIMETPVCDLKYSRRLGSSSDLCTCFAAQQFCMYDMCISGSFCKTYINLVSEHSIPFPKVPRKVYCCYLNYVLIKQNDQNEMRTFHI
ncbi:hypothetical protein MTR67_034015 [Solanum verrucosum]|uniref:Uncharacterized protein n=1 Tax=Solanum verrucosum TaxID=315347 RepID=A0AAF0U6Z5_SOLVR|nr:hypothetical protein MTR67_034015 [Solanum verrucosum]